MIGDLLLMPPWLQPACQRPGRPRPAGPADPGPCRAGGACRLPFWQRVAPAAVDILARPPMTTSDVNARMPDLRRAIDAVAAAMPLVRLMGATLRDVPPVEKGDGSPVTAADFAAQAVVVDVLRRSSPDGRVPLVGEESAAGLVSARRPDVERLVADAVRATLGWRDRAAAIAAVDGDEPRAGEPFWTVDPIDGTKGFVLGEQCSVCLALIEGARAAVGAIGCPRMGPAGDLGVHLGGPGTLYAAASGVGAFALDGARRVLRRLVPA